MSRKKRYLYIKCSPLNCSGRNRGSISGEEFLNTVLLIHKGVKLHKTP